jgi:hypothetical protein
MILVSPGHYLPEQTRPFLANLKLKHSFSLPFFFR